MSSHQPSGHIHEQEVLPPELQDYILDQLRYDKPTLSTCALVSHGWSLRSQYHLFRNLTVAIPATLDEFAKFLHSKPHLAVFIRTLTFSGTPHCNDIMYDSQFHMTITALASCMAELPFVDELVLNGVWWTDEHMHARRTESAMKTAPHSWSVKRLELKKVFVTPDALFDTICCFPRLKSLHAESVYWTVGIDRPPARLCPPSDVPAIRTVTVGSGSTYNMLRLFFPRLKERVSVSDLRSLAVSFDHLDPSSETRKFMDSVGPQLEHIHIQFGNNVVINSMTEQFIETLSLDVCKSLKHFEITLPGNLTSVVQPKFAWTLLHLILPKLSQAVEKVTITHRLDLDALEANMRNWDWSMLEEMLCNISSLKVVTIQAQTTQYSAEIYIFDADDALCFWKKYRERSECFFRRNLPTLAKQDKLDFQF